MPTREPPAMKDGGVELDAGALSSLDAGGVLHDAGPSWEPEVRELYAQQRQASRELAEFSCECETTTTDEFEECVKGDTPPDPPPILECVFEIYGTSEATLDVLECTYETNLTYLNCLQESTCQDFDHRTDCVIDLVTTPDCDEIPYLIWAREQEECWGREQPDPFYCGSGEAIDPRLVCDIVADCEDRSDEVDCPNDPHAGLDFD